jgi:hypothetical protein
MFEIDENTKTVKYTELWHIEGIKYAYENLGIYDKNLTDDDFFNILKNAMRKADYFDCNINQEIIENTINEYIEEND